MTLYLKSGNIFSPTSEEAMDLHPQLPTGTYTVKQNPQTKALYLEAIEGFDIRGKIYGDTEEMSTRILSTFKDRHASTGVMLSGEKGSGKTLLAKKLSVDAQAEGIPTIVINQPWAGEGFNAFIQLIEQPTVIIFDEFEKVYDRQAQEQMLTLLDGVYPSKKLFILTCNDKWRVDEHMRNRPGRIFYRLDFGGLEREFILEYCGDNLNDKTNTESVCRAATMFASFNFDILKAMVEEMNRYNESAQQVMKVLNAKPELGDSVYYDVALTVQGKAIAKDKLEEDRWHGNPLGGGEIWVSYYTDEVKNQKKAGFGGSIVPQFDPFGDDDAEAAKEVEDDEILVKFQVHDLKEIDSKGGKFIFINEAGDKLTLGKIKTKKYHYDAV